MALTADGRLYIWVWWVFSQVGHGDTEIRRQPNLVQGFMCQVVSHASAGYAFTLVLMSEGHIYGFGFSFYELLGLGHDVKQTWPVRISLFPERVILIATKYIYSLSNTFFFFKIPSEYYLEYLIKKIK